MFLQGAVQLKQGLVKGVDLDGVVAFKGIPYAKAPLGALRWVPAQPVSPWEGIMDCTQYRPSFTQVVLPLGSFYQREFYPTTRPMSEDGLNLNVWTPAKGPEDKLPVYVWIHGGAFTEGSGAALQFIGENLARKGVVVVTINYRLGAFGFMAHPQLTEEGGGASGNYAFTDMIQALRFIKENAQAFGGDGENITIDGQSAGSMSVCSLVASGKAGGLFQKAIAQSGSVFGRMISTREQAEQDGLKLMEALSCKSIDEMRLVPAEDIMAAVKQSGLWFRPIVDGAVIDRPFGEIYEQGLQNKVTLMVGCTGAEGCLEKPSPGGLERYKAANAESFAGDADGFFEVFAAQSDEDAAKMNDIVRTTMLFSGMKRLAECQSRLGMDAYLYCFDHLLPDEDGKTLGAFHSAELVYQFGTLDTGWRPWRDEDYLLSERMMGYIANFAKSGNPNGEGLPTWERFAQGNGCMHLNANPGMDAYPYAKKVEWMDNYLSRNEG